MKDQVFLKLVRELDSAPTDGLLVREKSLRVEGRKMNQREFYDHMLNHHGTLLTRDAVAYAMACCFDCLTDLIMHHGTSVTFEDFGQFRPRPHRVNGKVKVGILFVPSRNLFAGQQDQTVTLVERWEDPLVFDHKCSTTRFVKIKNL